MRFASERLSGGRVLTLSDAEDLAGGFDSISSLTLDATTGSVLFAENDVGSGANRIRRLPASGGIASILHEGAIDDWIDRLRFAPQPAPAVFAAFQPDLGGSLSYRSTDYLTTPLETSARSLRPARPQLDVAGPGTQGAGLVTLSATGAPPASLGLVFFGPAAGLGPEWTFYPASDPLFVALLPTAIWLAPVSIQADASGDGAIDFESPGLVGAFALQLLSLQLTPSMEFVATTNAIVL